MEKGVAKKSFGGIPQSLLFLGGIIIVIIIIVVIVINVVRKPPPPLPEEEKKPEPVYEAVVGDIKFKLIEVKDRGNILRASQSKHPEWGIKDLVTTERFIEVTVGVENVGKDNVQSGSWDIYELIDSEERHFYYSQELEPWVPEESKCGALLKPGFTPTLCTKIYEVAKISTDLKVRVFPKTTGMFVREEAVYIDLGL